MGPYFIILAFFLVGPVYCRRERESFIKTTNGKGEVKCDADSICVMNNKNHLDNNGNSSCSTGGSNVSYVCLKKEFQKSNCTTLTNKMKIDHSGCYKGGGRIDFDLNWNKYFQLFVLHGSLELNQQSSNPCIYVPTFGYCNSKYKDDVLLIEESWILVKFSNDSEKDLGKFFMEPPTDGKEEDKESEKGKEERSDDYFIQTINGMGQVRCNPDSICVMNNTERPLCSPGGSYSNVSYVCLKREFRYSNCPTLTYKMKISHSGCYTVGMNIRFKMDWEKFFNQNFYIFVLHGSLVYPTYVGWISVHAFGYFKTALDATTRRDSWVLIKVPDYNEEDFGEFFMDNNLLPPTNKKEEGKGKEKEKGKEEEKEKGKEKGKEEEQESEKGKLEINVWIILVPVGIFLLIVFLLVAFVFYRRNLQNAKSNRNIEMIPESVSGNGRK